MTARRRSLCRLAAGLIVGLLALLASAPGASADPALPPGFQDEIAIGGLEEPVNFRFAPDGRVFVATKTGKILVFKDLEDTEPTVFADLRGDVYDTGDRGLLGIALDPEFEEGRPYVYALYTWDHQLGKTWDPKKPEYGTPGTSGDPGCPSQNPSASCLVSGRLVRLKEDPGKPDHALESGGLPVEEELLQGWCQQFSSHSIGDLQFGPEGALYVSGGDGAAFESIPDYGQLGEGELGANPCGDPPGVKGTALTLPTSEGGALRSQNLKNVNGKILRVNRETGAAFPGNPLIGESNAVTKRVIAEGFRNPFRFTFDPQTGWIYTDNVGSSEIEEIDRFAAPPTSLFNSGWPCYEGPERQFQFKELNLNVCKALYAGEPTSTSPPFFYYSHGQSVVPEDECPIEFGSALGGIAFYEGEKFPNAYKGALFITDAVRGCVWVILPGEDGRPDPSTAALFLRENRIYPAVDIEEGPDGNLYYADLYGDEEFGPGAIHRITYAPGAPTARLSANPPYGATLPLKVTFDASKSTDPDEEALTYDWDRDGNGTFEILNGGAKEELTFTEKELEEEEENGEGLNKLIAVRVTDGKGNSSVARVTVYPGDDPPVPAIDSPEAGDKWKVGDPIELFGSAVDSEYVSLSNPKGEIFEPLGYYWSTRILHCPTSPTACHTHPLQVFAGVREGEFTAPEHDYPSYLEITLRVADERGLTGTKTLKLEPRTVVLTVASSPPGVLLTAGLHQGPSPLSVTAIEGSHLQVSAPPTTLIEGTSYPWLGWSDGGERIHTVAADTSRTITATYAGPPPPGERPKPVPPKVKIKSHPPKSTHSRTTSYKFTSNESGDTFKCKLDKGKLKGCRSPKVYKQLKPGSHTFTVVAIGPGGQSKPAKFSWKVLEPSPTQR